MSDDINESMAAFGSQINAPTPDNDDPNSLVEIKVVGVGGGGNNAINHMYRQGVQNVTFVVVNTDKKSLRTSPVPNKVQLGPGLGAGNRPEVGRDWAEKDIAKKAGISPLPYGFTPDPNFPLPSPLSPLFFSFKWLS